uniref:Uncharacterized protein n=1 Tax=Phlebotomus papatasi TaxID=29031 RepID=A0A1B0DHW0_PHLPP
MMNCRKGYPLSMYSPMEFDSGTIACASQTICGFLCPANKPEISIKKLKAKKQLLLFVQEENSLNTDSGDDSSDPGRLQVDISSSQEGFDDNENFEGKKTGSGKTPDKQAKDSGVNSEIESNVTDPATTQLWQVLAQSSINGGGNEATQLLKRMINSSKSLGFPLSLGISGSLSDQPIALLKVSHLPTLLHTFSQRPSHVTIATIFLFFSLLSSDFYRFIADIHHPIARVLL